MIILGKASEATKGAIEGFPVDSLTTRLD